MATISSGEGLEPWLRYVVGKAWSRGYDMWWGRPGAVATISSGEGLEPWLRYLVGKAWSRGYDVVGKAWSRGYDM